MSSAGGSGGKAFCELAGTDLMNDWNVGMRLSIPFRDEDGCDWSIADR